MHLHSSLDWTRLNYRHSKDFIHGELFGPMLKLKKSKAEPDKQYGHPSEILSGGPASPNLNPGGTAKPWNLVAPEAEA